MMNLFMLKKLCGMLFLVPALLLCGQDTSSWLKGPDRSWHISLEKALEEAKRENKKVYVLSTGSDWCGFCIRLYKDVLSQKQFKSFARRNLVLVYLDIPRRKPMPDAQKQYNMMTKRKLKFGGGVPSAKILNADGTLVHSIGGYRKLAPYMRELEQYGKASKVRTSSGRKEAEKAAFDEKNDEDDLKEETGNARRKSEDRSGSSGSSAYSGATGATVEKILWGVEKGDIQSSLSIRPIRLSCGRSLYFKLSINLPAGESGSIYIRSNAVSSRASEVFSGRKDITLSLNSRRPAKCRKLDFIFLSENGSRKVIHSIYADIQWER